MFVSLFVSLRDFFKYAMQIPQTSVSGEYVFRLFVSLFVSLGDFLSTQCRCLKQVLVEKVFSLPYGVLLFEPEMQTLDMEALLDLLGCVLGTECKCLKRMRVSGEVWFK